MLTFLSHGHCSIYSTHTSVRAYCTAHKTERKNDNAQTGVVALYRLKICQKDPKYSYLLEGGVDNQIK